MRKSLYVALQSRFLVRVVSGASPVCSVVSSLPNATDANADGKIAESNNISITFNQNDDVTASLLNEETRQSIENEIQAAADAAAAETAQEQENATVEENTDTANGDASNTNNTAVSNSNKGSSSNNSGVSSSENSSSKKSSSSGSKSNNSGSGSSSSSTGNNPVYGENTLGNGGSIDSSLNVPYEEPPVSNVPDPSQKGNGSWESEGKPDYVDKEFAGGYVPDDYTPGHE